MLRRWRETKNLTLREGAEFLGVKSIGTLSDIETGKVFPSPDTVALIFGATNGLITVVDHWKAWVAAHPEQFRQFRTAGRSAANAFRKPAKRRK